MTTPKPPAAFRLQLAIVKMLGWSNGLEGFLSLMALAWATSVVIDPDWWNSLWATSQGWTLTPRSLSLVLAASALLGLIGLWRHWRLLRMQSSVVAFFGWGLLALYDLAVPPVPFTQGAVMHGMLAAGELSVYVRILVGLDRQGGRYDDIVMRDSGGE